MSVNDAVQRRLDGLVVVEGESMSPLLDDGDIIGLRREEEYRTGDVVVAQDLRSEVVHVKVWGGLDEHYGVAFLNSVNPAFEVIRLKVQDISILGVAYGLFRLRKLKVR